MNFRGKQWVKEGNYITLTSNRRINVLQWNKGKKANFMVEVFGLPTWQQSEFWIHGKGQEARDEAIKKAFELSEKYPEGSWERYRPLDQEEAEQ